LRLPGKIVVWPANLDSAKSRYGGRKLPRSLGIQAPRLDEISDAAKRLSFDVEVVPAKAIPRSWWEKGGYIILPKKGKKSEILRSLAAEIRKTRAAKAAHEKPKK